MINLPDVSTLPLPWYNRPPLGLMDGTPVFAALVVRSDCDIDRLKVPPDIIVTPLKYSRLYQTFSLTIDLAEQTGAIHRVLQEVGRDFNIALMETVTIDQRSKHRITMVLEPPPGDPPKEVSFDGKKNKLIEKLKALGPISDIVAVRFANAGIAFPAGQRSRVLGGTVLVNEIAEWLEAHCGHLHDRYDFNRVVVSSNSEARFIRYLFPRVGTFEASITLEDEPSAMRQLTMAANNLDYNILLSRISKSESPNPAKHQKSVTVAICEPDLIRTPALNERHYLQGVRNNLQKELTLQDPRQRFLFNVPREGIYRGRSPRSIIDISRPRSVERRVTPPPEVAIYLKSFKTAGKKVVFVSQPDSANTPGTVQGLRNHINDAITGCNCLVFDGFTKPTTLAAGRADEIFARMWHADFGIFLAPNDGEENWLRPNQEIEWGFMRPICRNTVIVCSAKAATSRRRFMMPDELMITYDNLESNGDYLQVQKEVSEKISYWLRSG